MLFHGSVEDEICWYRFVVLRSGCWQRGVGTERAYCPCTFVGGNATTCLMSIQGTLDIVVCNYANNPHLLISFVVCIIE